MNHRLLVIIILFLLSSPSIHAQEKAPIKEMRWKLNEEGQNYLKLTFLNQTWLRFNESNPGTLVNGSPQDHTFDIGLRRTRLQFYGQINRRTFFYTQFGMNNFNRFSQNAGNRKLQAFFHDALGEFHALDGANPLKFGAGLTITNGLSRFSQPGVTSIMTTDVPIFAQSTVDQTDEFARKLSVYARGQLGKLDYRLALSDPFPVYTNGLDQPILNENATFNREGPGKQIQGFFIWNFLEREPHILPYMAGTYLGKKRIFNLEAGFITQPKATWSTPNNGADTLYYDLNQWAVSLFYDAPIGKKGAALNAYLGYFSMDYGHNYIRYNGIMNPANGLIYFPGGNTNTGNSFPMFGTGHVVYSQIGYLLPNSFLGEGNGQLMPYATFTYADFERLSSAYSLWDIGTSWLVDGHSSKFSINYQNRPIYGMVNDSPHVFKGSKGCVILQYQVFF